MKVSKLIEELQRIIDCHGDQEAYVWSAYPEGDEINWIKIPVSNVEHYMPEGEVIIAGDDE